MKKAKSRSKITREVIISNVLMLWYDEFYRINTRYPTIAEFHAKMKEVFGV